MIDRSFLKNPERTDRFPKWRGIIGLRIMGDRAIRNLLLNAFQIASKTSDDLRLRREARQVTPA